jgi:ribosome-associated translation inhibitor RaiA
LTHRKKPTLEEINDHDRVYMEKKSNRLEKSVFQSQTIDVSFKSHFY